MTATVDVIYLAHDRREFTEFTFGHLIASTNWERVRHLHVYDDASTDGTREMLHDLIAGLPVETVMHEVEYGSPVAVMNDYVASTDSDMFAKIDNDIVCPPGWLDALVDTIEAHPSVEILGCEAGRMGYPNADFDGVYTTEHARWIGGVGLMKTRTLGARPKMKAAGRFGWTEWQREYRPNIAWIVPDLAVADLSRIPFEPWASLSERYKADDLERDWPKYHERWGQWYWAWWAPEHALDELGGTT